jgi:hypothetical protein
MNEPVTVSPVCYNHPTRQTMLRCNRCDRPICTECAVLTPTGYRCKECVRGQQRVFNTARWHDFVLAVLIAGGLSLLGSWIASLLGFFTLFIAPVAGVLIAEAVRTVTGKRRSKGLYLSAVAATALGGLILPLATLLIRLVGYGGFDLWGLIWSAAYALLATSSVYYRLTGIQIR